MSDTPKLNFKYIVGGSLEKDAPSYVVRQADQELYDALNSGEFCYVFNARQMGKSSLRVRVMQRLQAEGSACGVVEITEVVESQNTNKAFYLGLAIRLSKSIGIGLNTPELQQWWQKQNGMPQTTRFLEFLEEILLKHFSDSVVVFIDEIDSILRFEAKDDFFALIRTCYNQRVDKPDYCRLTFALLGVATPSDLVTDESRTPFNIGKAIELEGFRLEEAETSLLHGLEGTADNPQAVLREILFWTGGQPFLTQRLCNLVINNPTRIVEGSEQEIIKNIAKSKIIRNWEAQDEKNHLSTIRDRLIRNTKEHTRPMLRLYAQIIQQRRIAVDKSNEQLRLQLTGCIVKRDGNLEVRNPIYQRVFNQDWLERSLSISELCYFSELMNAWEASNFKDKSRLLSGKALAEALNWSDDRSLSGPEKRFLRASQDKKNNQNLINISLIAANILIGAISAGASIYFKYGYCPINEGIVGEKIGGKCFRTLTSSGEKVAFLSSTNYHLKEGTKFFGEADGNAKFLERSFWQNLFQSKDSNRTKYEEALKLFEQAKAGDPSDPTPWIFYNNAKARLQNKLPLKIAVVASIDYYEDAAKEVLRGVADAQNEFNSSGGKNGQLLEIVVVNDGNEEVVAEKVAGDLASNKEILGIIGHHASESTDAALPTYEDKRIAVVSPTSSSSNLKSNFFFRSIGSTRIAAKKYANYIENDLKLDEIEVFLNPKSEYSKTLKEEIKQELSKTNKIRFIEVNIGNIEAVSKVRQMLRNGIKTALLISNVETNSVSIEVARANFNLPQDTPKIRLLGAMSLSEKMTLEKGRESIEGLTLFGPCLAQNSQHAKDIVNKWEQKPYWQLATERWNQEPYWRVETAYDATQAFIKAIQLSNKPDREEIWTHLKSLTLDENESSGFGLDWSDTSDRNSNVKRKYCLHEFRGGKLIQISNK